MFYFMAMCFYALSGICAARAFSGDAISGGFCVFLFGMGIFNSIDASAK